MLQTCNENLVVFIGPSGSGKTTAARLFSDVQKKDLVPTTEIEIYEKQIMNQKIILVDTPALKSDDTLADISNTVNLYNLIIKSRSVVLVFVLSYETISLMRGGAFRELLENLGLMCPLYQLKKHLHIYFSHVPDGVSPTCLKEEIESIVACESKANSDTVIGLVDFTVDSLEEEDGRVLLLRQLLKKEKNRKLLDKELGYMVKYHSLSEPAKHYKCALSAADEIKFKNLLLSETSNIVSMLNTKNYDGKFLENIGILLQVAPHLDIVQKTKSLLVSYIKKEMDSILLDFSLSIQKNNPASQKARIYGFKLMIQQMSPSVVEVDSLVNNSCFNESLLDVVLKYLSEEHLISMQEIYTNYHDLPLVNDAISAKVTEWAAERTKLCCLTLDNVASFWQSVTFLSSVSWLPIEKREWISELFENIPKKYEENLGDNLRCIDHSALVQYLQEPFQILEQIKKIPNYQQAIDQWLIDQTEVKVKGILKRAFMSEMQKVDTNLINRITSFHHIKQSVLLLSAFAEVNPALGSKFNKLTRNLNKKINSLINTLLLETEKSSPDWLEIEKQIKHLETIQWLEKIGIPITFRVQDILSNLDQLLVKQETQIKLQWRDEKTRHLVADMVQSIEPLQLIDSHKDKITQLLCWIVEQIRNYESKIILQLTNNEITIQRATEALHLTSIHRKILETIPSHGFESNLEQQLTDFLHETSENMLLQLTEELAKLTSTTSEILDSLESMEELGKRVYTSVCKILDSILYLKNAFAAYELEYAEAVDVVARHLIKQEGKIFRQISLMEVEHLIAQFSTALILQKHIPAVQEKDISNHSYYRNHLEALETYFMKDLENSEFHSALSKLKQLPERFIPGKRAILADELTKRLNSIKIACDIFPTENFLKQLNYILQFLQHFAKYLELDYDKYVSHLQLDLDNRLSCEFTNLNDMLSRMQVVKWYQFFQSFTSLHEELISETGKYKFTLPLTSMRLADFDRSAALATLCQNLLRCGEITKINELYAAILNAGNELLALKTEIQEIIRDFYKKQKQINQSIQELARLSREEELLHDDFFPKSTPLGKASAIKSLGGIFATIVARKNE